MDIPDRFRLEPQTAINLAKSFGTPLYVVDETTYKARLKRYRAAMERTGGTRAYYASKANPTPAIIRIANQEGLSIDVASAGELDAAIRAEVPPAQINFHGNNKSSEEIDFAIESRIGEFTIDHLDEIDDLFCVANGRQIPKINIRICPNVNPNTHEKIRTGQSDSKFGLPIVGGDAERAVLMVRGHGEIVNGLHAHVGSQLLDASSQSESAVTLASFAIEIERKHGIRVQQLNVGGGLGVAYRSSEPQPLFLEDYVSVVNNAVKKVFAAANMECPEILHEPGRALVANSGVTLYSIGAVKELMSEPVSRFVAVDGGVYENPRPALYGAIYDMEHIPTSPGNGLAFGPCTIAGKHCETDTLLTDVFFDARPNRGDLIQFFCTGAYNASMASNYNRLFRPAMVLIRQNGHIDVIRRRETLEDLQRCDVIPADL